MRNMKEYLKPVVYLIYIYSLIAISFFLIFPAPFGNDLLPRTLSYILILILISSPVYFGCVLSHRFDLLRTVIYTPILVLISILPEHVAILIDPSVELFEYLVMFVIVTISSVILAFVGHLLNKIKFPGWFNLFKILINWRNIILVTTILFILIIVIGLPKLLERLDGEKKFNELVNNIETAIHTKNITICDELDEDTEICYNNIAISLGNYSLCMDLNKDLERNYCNSGAAWYHNPSNKPSYCRIYDKFGGNSERLGSCIAEASGYDPENCRDIKTDEDKYVCLSGIFKETNSTDFSLCDMFSDESYNDECKLDLVIKVCIKDEQTNCSIKYCYDQNFSTNQMLENCIYFLDKN